MRRQLSNVLIVAVAAAVGAAGCAADGGSGGPDDSPSPTASPVAAADFAMLALLGPEESLADLGFEPVRPEDPDPIAAPGFTWALYETAVADEVDPEVLGYVDYPESRDLPEEPLRAGSDREFLLAWVRTPREAPRPDDRDTSVRLAVRVEDQPYHQLGDRDQDPVGGVLVVVSVPVGGDAVLEITDTGSRGRASESYSLSLRTGQLESGEVSAVDRLHGDDVLVSDAFQVSGLTPADQGEAVNCGVDIEPMSHHRSRGEAKDGHMWLEVEVTVTFGRYEDWMVAEHATLEVDLGASVTIVDDNGDRLPLDLGSRTASPPEDYPGGDPPGVTATQTVVTEVPDTLREFTVTFRLEATFNVNDGGVLGYQRYDQQNVGTITLTES